MMKINFAKPDVGKDEIQLISDIINTGMLTAGSVVTAFENKLKKYVRAERVVAYDSCTGAMEMTLRVLGIGPGDEVITTPYTYSATAEVIRNVGAKIVFVDLSENSFEMDYEKVAASITEHTKAVMPVDIGGKLCDYKALSDAVASCKDKFKPSNELQEAIGRVAIISDAAHSFGAKENGKYCLRSADFTCYSFHALKSITTGGEGGAVAWNDIYGVNNDKLERTFRLLGDHGQTSHDKTCSWEYDIAIFGYNSIMTNIDAAMGLVQLMRFNGIQDKRENVTAIYDTLFDCKSCGVTPLIEHLGMVNKSAMHLYPIRLPDHVGGEEGRNRIFKTLMNVGVPCNVHYKPLPMMTAYKNIGFDIKDFPNAYDMYKNLLTIPYHTSLTVSEQEYVVAKICEAVRYL